MWRRLSDMKCTVMIWDHDREFEPHRVKLGVRSTSVLSRT